MQNVSLIILFINKTNAYDISGLLSFRKAGDLDGFIGDFSAKTKVTNEIYQLKVRTIPGDALFEVSIVQDLAKNSFHTKVISRKRYEGGTNIL